MDRQQLHAHLNDHLAGSIAAVDLMHRLSDARLGAVFTSEMRDLSAAVESDERALRDLLVRIGQAGRPGTPSNWWMGESSSCRAMDVSVHSDGELMLAEALDVLALGFHGRLALWNSLATMSADVAAPHGYAERGRRVRDQLRRLHAIRSKADQRSRVGAITEVAA